MRNNRIRRGLSIVAHGTPSVVFVCALALIADGVAAQNLAQPVQLAARGPNFFSVTSSTGDRVNAHNAAVLRRSISLALKGVSVPEALSEIGRQCGLKFAYRKDVLPAGARVSLSASDISVEAALTVVLLDAGVDVELLPSGFVGLVPRATSAPAYRARQQGTASITGRVKDATTGEPLANAAVSIEPSTARTLTAPDGRYVLRNIPAGSYVVSVRFLGHIPVMKPIELLADSTKVADFAMVSTAATLDQIVTTGAGEQRRVELGNAIATINADSIAKTAPITSLTDLISGRTPNVDVQLTSGMTGDGPAIRIRGQGSITVPNDPILIIDGVRADGSPGGASDVFGYLGTFPSPSRLNDLNPSEIESVEVLRGPSAATEYGTDAANGVIVVKTKHGHSGAPRWNVDAAQSVTTMPAHFPDNYYSWGHTTGTAPTPVDCPLFATTGEPSAFTGTCAVDSVTRFQPLSHTATTEFGTGTRSQYGLQLSGGVPAMRYFVSGQATNEIGLLQMPPAEQARVAQTQGRVIPENQRRPNALDQFNLRSTVDAVLGRTSDVNVVAGYANTSARIPNTSWVMIGAYLSPGYRDSLNGYSGYAGYGDPGYVFARTNSEAVSRPTVGVHGNWRPRDWFAARGTVGLDDATRSTTTQVLPGQDPSQTDPATRIGGYRARGLYQTRYYSADFGATVTASPFRDVTFKTALGVQYTDRRESGTAALVTNLAPVNPSLNGAVPLTDFGPAGLELADESKTAGSYVEETIGVQSRLFLMAALREDAGSGFGSKYNAALYPKASISWLVVPESQLLRIRAAYGQSGVQPSSGEALRLLTSSETFRDGSFVPGYQIQQFGNANLRPERSEEVEGGADLSLRGGGLTVEFTAYRKISHDALINDPLPGSLGGGSPFVLYGQSGQENLGSVVNEGLEMAVTGHLIDTRFLEWDATVGGSVNRNRLVRLAPGVSSINNGYFATPYQQRTNYPVWGLWAVPIRYADLNHDRVIEPNEVTQGDSTVYVGPSLPTRQLSVGSGWSLFQHLRIAAQIDYRGGYRIANVIGFLANVNNVQPYTRAANDRTAPLWDQARAEAASEYGGSMNAGFVEDASFVRWRELSATYTVPGAVVRALRAKEATVTLSARNLALWTRYSGADPEVNNNGLQVISNGVNTPAVNHDAGSDGGAVPQVRYWILRVDLSL